MDDNWTLAAVAAFCVVGVAQLFPNVVSLLVSPHKVILAAVFSTVLTFLISFILDGNDPPTRPEGRA